MQIRSPAYTATLSNEQVRLTFSMRDLYRASDYDMPVGMSLPHADRSILWIFQVFLQPELRVRLLPPQEALSSWIEEMGNPVWVYTFCEIDRSKLNPPFPEVSYDDATKLLLQLDDDDRRKALES